MKQFWNSNYTIRKLGTDKILIFLANYTFLTLGMKMKNNKQVVPDYLRKRNFHSFFVRRKKLNSNLLGKPRSKFNIVNYCPTRRKVAL